jgi:hypothetical protein
MLSRSSVLKNALILIKFSGKKRKTTVLHLITTLLSHIGLAKRIRPKMLRKKVTLLTPANFSVIKSQDLATMKLELI